MLLWKLKCTWVRMSSCKGSSVLQYTFWVGAGWMKWPGDALSFYSFNSSSNSLFTTFPRVGKCFLLVNFSGYPSLVALWFWDPIFIDLIHSTVFAFCYNFLFSVLVSNYKKHTLLRKVTFFFSIKAWLGFIHCEGCKYPFTLYLTTCGKPTDQLFTLNGMYETGLISASRNIFNWYL